MGQTIDIFEESYRNCKINHTPAKMYIIMRGVELYKRKGSKRQVIEESVVDTRDRMPINRK